ncbi:hemagglutinin repeat-containing protein [Metapseudomonas otitidis]|uniref:hemagglutinin repeat-containing protein n=1 Tax=Metapseudomonas otitidis TaxID=319939 RepID=UPI001F47C5AF|nr:hemagglutinin repeat-containing protein [Pseudomonas otitidis]
MDVRSPFFQNIATVLIGVMFLNPIVSTAADLAVDAAAGGNTSLGAAANGVPVVNIATPNGNGLSHNKFSDYNVGEQGLILNNATNKLQSTQLGGYILGNPNLNGRAAGVILNEVTGTNPSQLKGYTEVAGQGAHVIVANPHGITCDGCGFINTPRATLSTGAPVVENGALKRYDVDGGQIRIEGQGLNASNVDQFELITRSAQINAELHARQLAMVTGRNDVDATTLAATAKADDGTDKPQLAIDSSALGGMYAGAIRLVGTEQGVGVKLAGDMAASGGDIQIDANGKLTLARTAASGNLTANATDIELTRSTYASGNARLTTGTLDNQERLAAGGDLRLNATHIDNPGRLEAGVRSDGSANTARPDSVLDIQGGTLRNRGTVNAQGSLTTDLATLDNQSAELVATGSARIKASTLDNRQGGQLIGRQDLTLDGQTLDNRGGTVASNKALTVTARDRLDNSQDGLILSKADGLTLDTAVLDNQNGTVQADSGELKATASTLDNRNGKLLTGQGALTVDAQDLRNQQGRLIAQNGTLTARSDTLDNTAGRLQGDSLDLTTRTRLDNSQGHITATQGNLSLTHGELLNDNGQIQAKHSLTVNADSLRNHSGSLGADTIDLTLGGLLDNSGGLVEAAQTLSLDLNDARNANGKLRALGSSGESVFRLGGRFDNDNGLVEIGNAAFRLSSTQLSNQGGTLRHVGNQGFGLNLADVGQAGGRFLTNGTLSLDVADWTNSSLLQAQRIDLKVGRFTQTATGQLVSIDDITASGTDWTNDGLIETQGKLQLALSGRYQGNGSLKSQSDMTVSAASAELGSGAQLRSGGNGDFRLGGALTSAGQLSAAGDLLLKAGSVDNRGTLGAAKALRIESDSLRNERGLVFSGADMVLRTGSLTNLLGDIYSLGSLSVARDDAGAQLTRLENISGSLESSGDMSLRAAVLSNRKETFVEGRELTYGYISVVCYDCSGDHHNVDYVATERFKTIVASDSAAGRINSGGNLDIQGGAVSNLYSSLSATGNVAIVATSLDNTGAASGTIERTRRFNTGRVTDGTDERFRGNYIDPYNARPMPKEMPGALYAWNLVSDIETRTPTGSAAPAIIQAGGNVSIQATQPLTNDAVITGQAPQAGASRSLDSQVSDSSQPLVVRLNAQLAPDAQQQAINPVALPGFSLPQGQNGLFRVNTDPGHPYLIETNPVFASLSGFINSSYLLDRLGFKPDETQRRLGDGLYEQRLLREAVIARTGKRFLDGLASDEAQFKYLMDNALASKERLNLAPGIALSAEQVAALTHDIVWMEEQEVSGQKVLVPVLYLAQAKDRLAPSGALIQGRDVALISGTTLTNSGTLRASNNLQASALNVSNSGLMQAGERLSLLATDSIRNARGGLINGKDVSAIALTGDIINERTISQESRSGRNFSQLTSVVDKAAGFEAGNSLSLTAGKDIQNIGGSLKAGGNATLKAGNDLVIASAAEENGSMRQDKRHFWSTTSTTQHGSDVQVGGDLDATATHDMQVQASRVRAEGSVDLAAGNDVRVTSAANEHSQEYRYRRSSKRITTEDRQVQQQASLIEAGKNLNLVAGNDVTVTASQLDSGAEAYLYAGNNLELQAAENSQYSFREQQKKSRSSKKSSLDETTTVTNMGAIVSAESDVALVAKNDLKVLGSTVESSKAKVSLLAGEDVEIDAVSDLTQSRHERSSSKKSWGGFKSSKMQSKVNETSTQAVGSLISGNQVSVQSGRDVTVTGSSVVSTQGTELAAVRDLTIDAATNTFEREASYKSKSRDLTGILTANKLGLDDITGDLHLSMSSGKGNSKAQETTLTGSTIGSSEGGVKLSAGRELGVVASDIVSAKNLSLTGSDVEIAAGKETASQSSKDSSRSLAVGRVVGGQIVDTAKSIYNNVKDARDTDDDRLRAVKTAQAVMSATSLAQTGSSAAANISEGKPANSSGSLIKIGTEVALTNKKATSEYTSEQAKQSNLNAGGTLSIVANGNAETSQGNIHVIGSNLKAAETELLAKRDIILESAQNRSDWNNKDTTNRTSVGASFNIGQQNGFTLDLGASVAKAQGKGHDVTQVNSHLDTGTLSMVSGKDTTLAGAQVRADKIQAVVGGDLNIASRQDQSDSKQTQKNGGFGASICVPPFCYGATVSGSASIGGAKTEMNYKAVNEQSGLYAGQGGYNVNVEGTTRLDGSVIASEATADKNRLSTDRLEHSDIRNRSEIKSQSASVSVSYSSGGKTKGGETVLADSGVGGGLPLALSESDKSWTRSAVSEGTIIVRNPEGAQDLAGLSRDTASANQGLDRPDEKAMRTRMELIQSTVALGQSVVSVIAQSKQKDADEKIARAKQTQSKEDSDAAEIALAEAKKWNVGGENRWIADIATGLVAAGLGGTGTSTSIGIVANTTAADTFKRIGDYADDQARNATDPAVKAAWEEGGPARVALHAAAGALQGLAGGSPQSGALGAGLSAAVMPAIEDALKNSGYSGSKEDRDAISTVLAASMGVVAGGGDITGKAVAGGTAAGVERYNRQLHPEEVQRIKEQAKKLAEETGVTEDEAARSMALALAFYVDKDWHDLISSKGDSLFDAKTLKHLAIALAPLAARYDVPVLGSGSDVPGQEVPIQKYSARETLDLLKGYSSSRTSEYLDPSINREYLGYTSYWSFNDEVTAQREFYKKYLNYSQGLSPLSSTLGALKGFNDGVGNTVEGAFNFGLSVMGGQGGNAALNGIAAIAKEPGAAIDSYFEHNQAINAEAYLYWLQGDSWTAQQIEWTRDTELAANFVPVGGGAKALSAFAKDAFKAGSVKASGAGVLAGVADAEAGLSGSRGASGTAGETNHIGSSLSDPKTTRWNPSAKDENCIACVASYMTERLNGAAGEFLSADDVERIYASVHPSRGLQLPEAVEILHRVSKSDMAPVKLSPFAEGAPVGQYALFFGPRADQLRHVIHAEVLPNNGGVRMFDPQNGLVVTEYDILSLKIKWGGKDSRVIPVFIRAGKEN